MVNFGCWILDVRCWILDVGLFIIREYFLSLRNRFFIIRKNLSPDFSFFYLKGDHFGLLRKPRDDDKGSLRASPKVRRGNLIKRQD